MSDDERGEEAARVARGKPMRVGSRWRVDDGGNRGHVGARPTQQRALQHHLLIVRRREQRELVRPRLRKALLRLFACSRQGKGA